MTETSVYTYTSKVLLPVFFVSVNFGTAPPLLPPSILIDKVRAPAIRIVVENVVFLLSQIEDCHVLI